MTLNPRKSPALFSALSAGLTLFVASFFDLWTVQSGFGLLSIPRSGNLWELLDSLPVAGRHVIAGANLDS
jgi:hypothetical protein